MQRFLLSLLLLFIASLNQAQLVMLTPEEHAMLYHVVVKSPALERNLSEVISYTGDTVYFDYEMDKQDFTIVNYDSIEKFIQLSPNLLRIDQQELSSMSTGLLSELASKMALYKLYKDLKLNFPDLKDLDEKDLIFRQFIDTLVSKLPGDLIRKKNGKDAPSKDALLFMNPNLYFNQKVGILNGIQTLDQVQHKAAMDAMNYAVRFYLNAKGKEYFSKLTHNRPEFQANLLACGDGSNTDGLLNEREKIYKNKNELGDPIGVGLFTYETQFETVGKKRQELKSLKSHTIEYTPIKNDYTSLHFSLWGFNRDMQTTVAVYREDKMYLLYASKFTKELSTDTLFGKGATLQGIIKKLESKYIPDLDEEINGKDGYREQLLGLDTNFEDNRMEIYKTEMELTTLRYNTKKNRKKIKKKQDHLAWLYERKAVIRKRKEELIAILFEEEQRLGNLTQRLLELKSYLAYDEISHTKFGIITTFEDGVTFNANTQDLVFPDSLNLEDLTVRLITFGKDAMSDRVDEIQLLTTVSKGEPEDWELHDFIMEYADVFKSDDFFLDPIELPDYQRFELSKILNLIYTSSYDLNFNLTAGGVGVLTDGRVRSSAEKELDNYPGEEQAERDSIRNTEQFSSLRTSYLSLSRAHDLKKIIVEIESYTDPVRSRFVRRMSSIKELRLKLDPITENQLLSAFRSFQLAEEFTRVLYFAAQTDFSEKQAKFIQNHLIKQLEKSSVEVGTKTLKYGDYSKIANPELSFSEVLEKEKENSQKEIESLLGISSKKKR